MPVLAVAPDVWRITTPLPFRPRAVHAYLAGLGRGYLLVDGGIDTDAAWAALDAGVRAVAGRWEHVAVHVVTHMHLDHLGLVHRVRAAARPRLVMGGLDARRARHAHLEPDEEAGYRESLLRRNGAPPEVVAAVQRGRDRAAAPSAYDEPDDTLEGTDGDLPGAPGWAWAWTPGHTAGHVSLLRTADRLLVAGDAVLPRITPTIGVNRQRDDPVGDYLGALDRLLGLRPARILPGHGEPIEEPDARLHALREATLQESERVLACLESTPATAWDVAARRHPAADLPASVRMLALREALAHLQRLEAAGRVRREEMAPDVDGFARADAQE